MEKDERKILLDFLKLITKYALNLHFAMPFEKLDEDLRLDF